MPTAEIAQPSTTDRIDVSSLVQEAASEEVALEGLAEKETLTAEDLRGYLGDEAKDLDDDALLAAWKKTAGEEEPTKETETPADGAEVPPASAAWDRPWKFFKGDAAVEDVTKLSAKEMLELAISYKAGGADQKRTVDELVRLAQRVPLDEQRINGLIEQTREQTRALQEAVKRAEEAETDRQTWLWALQDQTGARFQKLQERFLAAGPPETRQVAASDDAELNRAGEEFYQARIVPTLQEMARSYSLDGGAATPEVVQHLGTELDRHFRQLVEADAAAMSNPQYAAARLQQILQYDLPQALHVAGYKPARGGVRQAPVAPAVPTPEVKGLQAQLTNLQTQLAKEKLKRAPGPGGGTTVGSGKGGPDLSKVKSFHDVLDVIRSPETQWDID
jgi:hypothetical protein